MPGAKVADEVAERLNVEKGIRGEVAARPDPSSRRLIFNDGRLNWLRAKRCRFDRQFRLCRGYLRPGGLRGGVGSRSVWLLWRFPVPGAELNNQEGRRA